MLHRDLLVKVFLRYLLLGSARPCPSVLFCSFCMSMCAVKALAEDAPWPQPGALQFLLVVAAFCTCSVGFCRCSKGFLKVSVGVQSLCFSMLFLLPAL